MAKNSCSRSRFSRDELVDHNAGAEQRRPHRSDLVAVDSEVLALLVVADFDRGIKAGQRAFGAMPGSETRVLVRPRPRPSSAIGDCRQPALD